MAEEVHDLDPQKCRPGGSASANHLNLHDAHDHVSRRRDASDGEIQSPKPSRRYLWKKTGLWTGPTKKNPKPTSQQKAPAPRAQPPQAPASSQRSDSRQGRERQESLKCGPRSLPQGSWNVMPTATQKPGVWFFGGQQNLLCRSWGRRPCEGNHSHYTPRSPAQESLPGLMDSGLEGSHSLKPGPLRSRSRGKYCWSVLQHDHTDPTPLPQELE